MKHITLIVARVKRIVCTLLDILFGTLDRLDLVLCSVEAKVLMFRARFLFLISLLVRTPHLISFCFFHCHGIVYLSWSYQSCMKTKSTGASPKQRYGYAAQAKPIHHVY